MGAQRNGSFIGFIGEDGLRNLVRINAVQWLCDVDECQQETWLTVANRTILIREPLDTFLDALALEEFKRHPR